MFKGSTGVTFQDEMDLWFKGVHAKSLSPIKQNPTIIFLSNFMRPHQLKTPPIFQDEMDLCLRVITCGDVWILDTDVATCSKSS
jgi:hypothetical protein